MCGIGYIHEECSLEQSSNGRLLILSDGLENNSDHHDENGEQIPSPSSSSLSNQEIMIATEHPQFDTKTIEEMIERELTQRGPDHLGSLKIASSTFIGSVLSLRGERGRHVKEITKQPIANSDHVLLWNGEIFNYPNMGEEELLETNDTELLFELLNNHVDDEREIITIFNSIQGPFAFVYCNIKHGYVLFGRDRIGKRSLVYHYSGNRLIISSNGIPGVEFHSIPPCIFQLKNNTLEKHEYEHKLINEKRELFQNLQDLQSEEYVNILKSFHKLFSTSVHRRINYLTRPSLSDNMIIENEANYAILFSGGIDSLVLASLSHLNDGGCEKITLLNVSFGNSLEQVSKGHDRVQSIDAFKMLNEKYNDRFNLVLIDVLKPELEEHSSTIKQLISPNNTVLDYTIGCVLWFASRGKGYLYGSGKQVESKSRVLLCGIGSDEIFGGYRRYLKRFKDEGWEGLNREMNMDLNRLWYRNLGRDDRIISSHGKECRHPFLDENLIEFVQSLPLNYIVDLRDKIEFEIKEGCNNSKKFILAKDKLLLRQMVSQLLELESNQPKKAMQFASNVAKITLTTSRRKERGDKCID